MRFASDRSVHPLDNASRSNMDAEFSWKDTLEEIARYRMPFGLFGPRSYPPQGVPIYDLPIEYLAWFAVRGWPKGKLGRLLEVVYQLRADGNDFVFDEIRLANGGRFKFRKEPSRNYAFCDESEEADAAR